MSHASRALAPLLLFVAVTAAAAPPTAADRVYRNATVFTAATGSASAESIAIRGGKLVYVGTNAGVAPFIGAATQNIDLKGRFVMPGLVDGHMHPLDAGMSLLKCSLNYESLTVPEFQARVQGCIDKSAAQEPDAWLEIVDWFQESMRPSGVQTSAATLDVLKTKRPIIVRSSFGHTALVNSRALALGKFTAATKDPVGGKIWRDAKGNPTGLLEDAAFEVYATILPKPTPADEKAGALAALKAMNRQGITSFLDAVAPATDVAAFSAVRRDGKLTVRAHFAPPITPAEANAIPAAIERVLGIRKTYDEGALVPAPGITVRNAKLFMDGVISAPAFTGAVVDPYLHNAGTAAAPNWVPGPSRGPPVYFPPDVLARALVGLGKAGIDPHLHADGDGGVRAALDGIAALRKALPNADIRPAIAHDEIVQPSDLPRFKALNATPVLSFQWEKPAGDTLGLKDAFGPERMKILEPAGTLAAAGARIAYGSDWPVDKLDEWFALKVGVTRTNAPDAPAAYRGRLGTDPGLSRETALRAITINAAYELHEDDVTGSLEAGKFADLIVLDRNPLTIPAEDIAKVQVLETVIGGKTVYDALHP